MPNRITIDDALSVASPSPVNEIYSAYPGLKRYGVQIRESTAGKDWRGEPYAGRKMEFYPPDESYNPNPGKPTVELFSKDVSPDDVMGEIFSHYLPRVDKEFGAARDRFISSIDGRQKQMLLGDYEHQMRSGAFEDRKPTFDQWLSGSGGDAFFRGYVANQYPKEFYRSDQVAMFQPLMNKLKTEATAITFDDAMSARESQIVGTGGNPSPSLGLDEQFESRPDAGGKLRTVIAPAPKSAENINFGASLKQNIVADEETKRREIAKSLFPDDPKGIERVGFVDGVASYVDDEGQLRRVSPKLASGTAIAIASFPEAIGSAIGSLATGNPISGAAIGGMGGAALKRGLSGLMFDEPVTAGGVATEMAAEGALNIVTGVAGKGVVKFSDRGRIVDFTPKDIQATERVISDVKTKFGIDLDLAQASGDRKLIALRNYVARYPGKSAQLIQALDEANNDNFEVAANKILDLIARAEPSEISGASAVNAAQIVLRASRESVYNDVDPLYRAAYNSVPHVTDERVLNFLQLPRFQKAFKAGQELYAIEQGARVTPKRSNTEILTQRNENGSFVRNTNRTESTLTDAEKVTRDITEGAREDLGGGLTRVTRVNQRTSTITNPSLRELEYTKRALDREIEGLAESGSRHKARALRQQRDQFVVAMDAIPDSRWRLARQRYGELINERVTPLERSPVGVLAGIDDAKLATAAAKIFSDPNTSAQQIRNTRSALSIQDPDAWNGIVRQWLGGKLNVALKETQTGSVVNPAGKFRQAVYGTPTDRAKAEAMLPANAAKVFDEFMGAIEKLSSTPIRGSDTASNQLITEQLKGKALAAISWIISPRQAARSAAEDRALESGVESLTNALLNPQKRNQLRQVARMAPSTRQAILLSSILSGQAVQAAVAAPDDSMPPALGRTGQ